VKPVAIRKSRPVAVKKADIQYNMQGEPSLVVGAGGGGGSGGRSKRERALSALGGLVGVAGGMLGPHRSIGSLAGSAYVGGSQGSQIGAGLGRKITSRGRQAQLDTRESRKKIRAEERGQLREDYRDYRGPNDEKAPRIKVFSRDKDQQRRDFLSGKDPGGKYDTAEEQAARATREKGEAYFAPEARKLRYEQEQERQDMKVAVKDRAGVPARKPLMDITHQQELPNTAEARRIERIRNNEDATVTSAGGQGSPASQGNVLVTEQNEHAGEEFQGGSQDYDHARHGVADELSTAYSQTGADAQNRLQGIRVEMSARGQLGLDQPSNGVAVTGKPPTPQQVDEETRLIQEQTGNNPLGLSSG